MLVDLDYFYAQCEERRNPSIKDKPVVVCVYSGRSKDSGAVSTSNYIARKFGVKSGISIYLAKKKLEGKNAVFLPVDRKFYEKVSTRIMDILRIYADRFEQVSIDEAYLDATQRVNGNFEEAKKLAELIKKEIKKREELTCSIGIGPNKVIAKIAAGIEKPDGLTIVQPEKVEKIIASLPVNKLPWVGVKTMKKMKNLGIQTIGDLSQYNVQKLVEVFGKVLAAYFHNASKGIDNEPVQEKGEAESISRISTLKRDTKDFDVINPIVDDLCVEIIEETKLNDIRFKSVGIILIMEDMSMHARSKTFDTPTNDLEIARQTVRSLFRRFLDESDLNLRRVGVKISNLRKEKRNQTQLMDFV
jgi:DNA polymerase IV (DinB-like DNA polymerase)